jgi:diguanylate cyclase (GGDEF)-like protein
MNFKSKLYISLIVSFILLISSLIGSYTNLRNTNKIITSIKQEQIKLSYLANKLNYDVKMNQATILQSIVLKEEIPTIISDTSLENLSKIIKELKTFIQTSNIQSKEIQPIIDRLQTRILSYKSVQDSLTESLASEYEEDVQDAALGLNSITAKFSQDTDNLIDIANTALSSNLADLQKANDQSGTTLLLSFFTAFALIIFSIYKFTNLNNTINKELQRAENAEKEQKKLQAQLLKYNDDLETEISRKTEELHKQIYTHFLSGLPNRNKLLEDTNFFKFKQMALLNIDKFQQFNDINGEEIGNIAINMSAKFLKNILDDDAYLYHLGGDEFVIAMKNASNFNQTLFIDQIENILNRYEKENFIYDGKKFNLIMSAGIAFHGTKKMLAYADMALKDAKKRNIQLSIFNDDKELEKIHKEDIECLKNLKSAFETNGIVSYFQPIKPVQDNKKSIKYESLVRIKTELGKVIPPFNFIKVAKKNRLYGELTEKILNNTLSTIVEYKVPCSINISMDDIENILTLNMLYARFTDFEYNHLLTIELLETEEFKDYETVFDFCTNIRSYGIKIALDDFGAGYSNFSHILKLPVDFIKIDASLISNIDRDTHSVIMVETIVGLAKKLKIETIAEFVSSQEILDVVTELGVDYVQGYHIGKPEPIENYVQI